MTSTWVTSSPTSPELVVGIDPSLRHTGLVLERRGRAPIYHEIKTGSAPVVGALGTLREGFRIWLAKHEVPTRGALWAIERQMAQAEGNGWLMMLAQTAVCEVIADVARPPVLMVAPYPNQLKAYISRVHGVKVGTKTQIRQGHRRLLRLQFSDAKLVSSHKAEAWFLAQMARDVVEGRWSYEQSTTKPLLFPWPILRGGSA